MGQTPAAAMPREVLDYSRRDAEQRWLADQPSYIRLMAHCQIRLAVDAQPVCREAKA